MKKYNLIIILCVFAFATINAQNTEDTDSIPNPYFSLKLGQSSDNAFTKSKPAQLIASFPTGDSIPDSYLINAYSEFSLNWFEGDLSIGVTGEIQKNTLIDKEQDVRQFGLTFLGKIPNKGNGQFVVSGSLKQSKDLIKDQNALQAHAGIKYHDFRNKNWLFKTQTVFPYDDQKGDFGHYLAFRFDYSTGLGYIGGDEEVLFAKVNTQIEAFPLYGLFKKEFKQPEILFVSYNLNARSAISGDTTLDINPLHTFSAGSSYKINEETTLSLAYNLSKGANPFAGLANQEFRSLTVKFIIDISNKG